MHITEERKPGVFILGLSKRLDGTTAQIVEDRILGIIDAGDRHLVIDLAQLEYVSSAGLRVFLLAAKRLNATNGRLALAGPTDHVRQVFDIAGVTSYLSVHASRDEAIRHVEHR
jgi:anti-anti-sigma factor